jgi:hypothetical protein
MQVTIADILLLKIAPVRLSEAAIWMRAADRTG